MRRLEDPRIKKQVGRHGLGAWVNRRLGPRVMPDDAGRIQQRAVTWLRHLGAGLLPGEMRIEVPAGPSRRRARVDRCEAVITYADWLDDVELWAGLGGGMHYLKAWRILRWCYEIRRQDGWASLGELAQLANIHQAALQRRLRHWRDLGVWVPHVAGEGPDPGRVPLDAWLLDRGDRPLPEGVPEAARIRAELAADGLLLLMDSGMATPEACLATGRAVEEARSLEAAAVQHALSGVRGRIPPDVEKPGLEGVEAEWATHFDSGCGTRGLMPALDNLVRSLAEVEGGTYRMPLLLADEDGRGRIFVVDISGGHAVGGLSLAEVKSLRIRKIRERLQEQGVKYPSLNVGFLLGMHPEAVRRHAGNAPHPEH